KMLTGAQIPAVLPATPQFSSTYNRTGGGSATAIGSITQTTNTTTAGFKFGPGFGVTQNNPNHLFSGYSSFRLDFNNVNVQDLVWDLNSNFGPPAQGFFSVALGGKVGAGAGSFAEFLA